jgi:hypothetical protein
MSQVRVISVWINVYFHAHRLDLVSYFINVFLLTYTTLVIQLHVFISFAMHE